MKYDRSSRARRKAISDATVWVHACPCLASPHLASIRLSFRHPIPTCWCANRCSDLSRRYHLPTKPFSLFISSISNLSNATDIFSNKSCVWTILNNTLSLLSSYFREYYWSKIKYIRKLKNPSFIYISKFISYISAREKDGLVHILFKKNKFSYINFPLS